MGRSQVSDFRRLEVQRRIGAPLILAGVVHAEAPYFFFILPPSSFILDSSCCLAANYESMPRVGRQESEG
jgi:hypothetical protein